MRFGGTVEVIAPVDIADMVSWISAVPFADWPQQHPVDDQLRPAMVSDPSWHGFGARIEPIVAALLGYFPGCSAYTPLLSVVMPGHAIDPHRDHQEPRWRCRVHVPLTSNDQSEFLVDGRAHRLEPGLAYQVNTEIEHSVVNRGVTPRVHFMFDVREL